MEALGKCHTRENVIQTMLRLVKTKCLMANSTLLERFHLLPLNSELYTFRKEI